MRKHHIETRLEQQVALSRLIVNSYDDFVKPGPSNITSIRIQSRSTTLKEDWKKFSLMNDAIQIAIRELSLEDQLQIREHPYLQEDMFASTREYYLNSLDKMTALEKETITDNNSNSDQLALQVSATMPYSYQSRLPRIDLPKFDGNLSEWLPFKDLFNSIVTSNLTLSAVEKLQYLKTSIIGSAAHLLSTTALTADNFQKAWEALSAFYENKRLFVNAALHSLFTLKRINSESAAEMEQLYTKIKIKCHCAFLHQKSSHEELLLLLQWFWELETISNIQDHTLTSDDQQCEDHFKLTHSRDRNGRYVVRLPFKENPSKLGDSKSKVTRMVARLFEKFSVESTFANLYSNFMKEYSELRHSEISVVIVT